MARALKCDRCGTLYEIPRQTQKVFVVKDPSRPNSYLDLCSECQSTLESWLWRNYEEKNSKEVT